MREEEEILQLQQLIGNDKLTLTRSSEGKCFCSLTSGNYLWPGCWLWLCVASFVHTNAGGKAGGKAGRKEGLASLMGPIRTASCKLDGPNENSPWSEGRLQLRDLSVLLMCENLFDVASPPTTMKCKER
eukprot:scaffold23_cov101-Skeletonema_dohrnii-CCMP3373.AAC.2